MPKLNDDHKTFIVQALACYDTPTHVTRAFKEEFGLAISRRQVCDYNPATRGGRTLSKRWRDLFEATRRRFLEEAAEIPIANQSYRLRQLQRMLERAMEAGNIALSAQLLEQAAKEVGGSYNDRRRVEVSAPDGGPVRHMHAQALLYEMSDEELLRIAAGGRTINPA